VANNGVVVPLDVHVAMNPALVLPSSLTVSIVTYRSDAALLERCLAHLAPSIAAAREDRV
jgi:hypothetical protein